MYHLLSLLARHNIRENPKGLEINLTSALSEINCKFDNNVLENEVDSDNNTVNGDSDNTVLNENTRASSDYDNTVHNENTTVSSESEQIVEDGECTELAAKGIHI